MSLNRKLFSISASDAAVCNSESLEPFGEEASFNKNVAVYQFEDNLNDSSGNGNNGTNITDSAVTYNASGKFGKAASFDGTNDGITIPAGLGTSGDRSRSLWIKISTMPASSTGDNIYYIGHGTANSYYESLSVRETAGASTYKFRWDERHNSASSPTDNQKLSTATLTTGVWYHVVIVQEGTSRKIYINGSLDSTHTNANSVNNTAYLTSIGSWKFGDCCFYDGLIDQFRFYNDKALSAEEVTTLYVDETTSTASSTTIIPGTSCIAYYPLDYDGQDKSTNYDGTATAVEFVQNGKINYSAKFNGTTSKIQITSPIGVASGNENDNFSVSMWVKWDSVSSTASGLHGTLVGDYTGSNYGSFHIYVYGLGSGNGLALSFERYFNSTAYWNSSYLTVGTISTLEADTWYYITHTYVGSSKQVKLYSNTTLIATYTLDTASGGRTTNSYNVIGDYNNSSGNGHAGSIDEFRIFNKTLSSDEVTTLAGLTACTPTCTTDTADFVTTNLAYYKLDGDDDDSHGGTHNGTASNLTYASGRFGSAGSFNGTASSSGSRVTIPQAIFSDGALKTFAISLWFKTDNKSATQTLISTYPYSSGTGFSLFLTTSGHLVAQLSAASGSGAPKMQYQTDMCDNLWHHAVLTYSSSGGTNDAFTYLYVDGSDVTGSVVAANGWVQGSVPTWSSFTSNLVTIGMAHDSSTYSETMNGLIDQVRVFGSAISASNVQSLYDSEFQCYITKDASQPFGGSSEKAFYKFSEGSSTTVADSTGSLTGTANGMTWSSDAAIGSYSGDFDGSNDYLSHASPYSHTTNTEDVSISWWFNTDTTYASSGFDTMLGGDIANSSGNGGTVGINIYGHGTKVVYVSFTRIWGSSANYYPSASTSSAQHCTIEPGRWYHGVITYDPNTSSYGSSTSSFYLNGVKVYDVTMSTYTTSGNGTGATLAWGQYRASNTFYNGKLDHIRFYNTILTGEQVWKLYAERNN